QIAPVLQVQAPPVPPVRQGDGAPFVVAPGEPAHVVDAVAEPDLAARRQPRHRVARGVDRADVDRALLAASERRAGREAEVDHAALVIGPNGELVADGRRPPPVVVDARPLGIEMRARTEGAQRPLAGHTGCAGREQEEVCEAAQLEAKPGSEEGQEVVVLGARRLGESPREVPPLAASAPVGSPCLHRARAYPVWRPTATFGATVAPTLRTMRRRR